MVAKLLTGLLVATQLVAANVLPRQDAATLKALEFEEQIMKDNENLPEGVPGKLTPLSKASDPAAKLVKKRYGPYKTIANSMYVGQPFAGIDYDLEKPCEDCYITAFQGGMEYEDGSNANVDTGIYLHHFVLSDLNKPDAVCSLKVPGGEFRKEYLYNTGNERPPVRLNTKGKWGMQIDKGDKFAGMTEIMNMSKENKNVYVTILYEWVPKSTPDYKAATHIRIDVTECGWSDVPAKEGAYKYTSPAWKSQYSGDILHNDGHGHAGTDHVDLLINDKSFCDSIQYYGLRKDSDMMMDNMGQGMSMDGGASGEMQVNGTAMKEYTVTSDSSMCEGHGRLEKGDTLQTVAYYNSTKYAQMVFKGDLEDQMGISFLYIGRDPDTLGDKLEPDTNGVRLPIEMGNLTAPAGSSHMDRRASLPLPSSLPVTPIKAGTTIRRTERIRRHL